MTRILNHVRSNVIAYLALFVALGGSSYAAMSLPAGSVGPRELKNGSIDPPKMDPRTIGGTIRHWASVSAQGRVLASSSRARGGRVGNLINVEWGDKFPASRCIALATIHGINDPSVDPVETSFGPRDIKPTTVTVQTFNLNQSGPATAESVFVAVIC
jgi:hypothetical protein